MTLSQRDSKNFFKFKIKLFGDTIFGDTFRRHFFIDRLIEQYFWWHFLIHPNLVTLYAYSISKKKITIKKKNGLLIWWHYFWWHFFRFSFPKNQFRNIPTKNRATCASGSGSGRGHTRPFSSSPSIIIIWWHFLSHFQPRATTKITFGDTLLSTFRSRAITHLVTLFTS